MLYKTKMAQNTPMSTWCLQRPLTRAASDTPQCGTHLCDMYLCDMSKTVSKWTYGKWNKIIMSPQQIAFSYGAYIWTFPQVSKFNVNYFRYDINVQSSIMFIKCPASPTSSKQYSVPGYMQFEHFKIQRQNYWVFFLSLVIVFVLFYIRKAY